MVEISEKELRRWENRYSEVCKRLDKLERGNRTSEFNGGFIDRYGRSVKAGDEVLHVPTAMRATLLEALQDGDAEIKFKSGVVRQVKWVDLTKVI